MNDKLLMENYLLVLKSTVEVFVHGTLESSNEDVRELLKDCLSNTIDCQKDTYNLMTDFGFYEVKNIKASEISKTLNKVNKDN